MQALLVAVAIFGQAEILPPPAPSAPSPPRPGAAVAATPETAEPQTFDEMKTWLLTRLMLDLSFDPQKSAEAEQAINMLNEQQLRVMIGVYKERHAQRDQAPKRDVDTGQRQTLEQARLGLQQAEAYRDHLKREFDLQVLQSQMNQNLLYQNMVNNQRMMSLTGGPYTYAPYGIAPYGAYGYGVNPYGYGGYYGPGVGAAVLYGSPSYGVGVGFY